MFLFWRDGHASWYPSNDQTLAIVLAEGSTQWPTTGGVNAGMANGNSVEYLLEPNGAKSALIVYERAGRVKVETLD
jgi:hypothetical protein